MLRKTILTGAAALTLGTAALAPTGASAWWGGHPRWHGWHHGFYRPAIGFMPARSMAAAALRAAWSGRPMGPRCAGSMSVIGVGEPNNWMGVPRLRQGRGICVSSDASG